MEAVNKKLKSNEGVEVEFPSEFGAICKQFDVMDASEPMQVDVSTEILQFIHKFYETLDWKEPKPTITPLQTNDLKKEIGEKCYDLMLPYAYAPNIPKLIPVIEAAFALELQGLQDIAMATAAIEFIFDNVEQGVAEYKKKYNVTITPEEEEEYKKEYEQLWEDEYQRVKMQEEQNNKKDGDNVV
ncbi:hypothetical protein PPERSA_10018 [Pseudocohnilembus persalinus]|uniref:SKP1 component dimerisation domain-containing protein n=1 Tax=Pseudocohnilembus persalinus TaxID=266149 RepID=A0A0V0QJK9_PSEPJ|nr:hypothetical protein PPERSA_10018 [Pseudocohnilembus persalinus]|eukprot:KRX02401.1 hypothetical protein PPERSA_10018 [Pseudocohnilembus persalinus]